MLDVENKIIFAHIIIYKITIIKLKINFLKVIPMKKRFLLICAISIVMIALSERSYSQHSYAQGIALTAAQVINTSYQDETLIHFASLATDGFDSKFDGKILLNNDPNFPNFYSIIPGYTLASNGLPSLEGDKRVYLGLQLGAIGSTSVTTTLSISAADIKGFNPNTIIWLQDSMLGTSQNLILSSQYTFAFHSPTNTNVKDMKRFAVCFDYNGAGKPVSTFTVDPSPVSANSNVTINFTGGTVPASASYVWNFAGGHVVSGTGAGPYQVYWDAAGIKNVTLTVKGICFNSTVTTNNVTVNPPVQASITPEGPTTVCLGQTVILDATAGAGLTYQWLLNGGNIDGATNSSYTADASGSYTVQVNSSVSSPVVVTVNPLPQVYDVTGGGAYCRGTSGVSVNLDKSQTGVYYQLYLGINAVGSGVTGTGLQITFGNQTEVGKYTVVATDEITGCQTNMNGVATISVNPIPDINITPAGTLSKQAGESLDLTSNSTSTIETYQWIDGGTDIPGATASTFSILILTTGDSGYYSLFITDNNGCTNTSNIVTVNVTSQTPFTVNVSSITAGGSGNVVCDGETAQLTAEVSGGTGNYTYLWTPEGATTKSYTTPPLHTDVVYSVLVSDGVSSDIKYISLTVNPLPVAKITYTGLTTFCAGGTLALTAQNDSGDSFQWLFNGNNINAATNDTYTADQTGSYTVSVTNLGCSSVSSPVSIELYPTPQISIQAQGSTTFLPGDSLLITSSTNANIMTYQWQLDGADINGASNAVIYVKDAGTYILVIIDENGCTNTSNQIEVSVLPYVTPVLTMKADLTLICKGSASSLQANVTDGTGSYTYKWSTGESTAGISVTPGQTTTYTVTVNDGKTILNGSLVITVNSLPDVTIFSANQSICQGNSATLTANGANSYSWSTGTNGPILEVSPFSDTKYIVTGTDGNGCKNTYSINVKVNTYPIADMLPSGPTTFCQGGSVAMDVNTGAGYTYQWLLNGQNINDASTNVFTATQSGKYSVVVTNNQCSSSSVNITVTVNPIPVAAINAVGSTAICQGSNVELDATTGANYTYQWILNGNNIQGATNAVLMAIAAGNYTLNVRSLGCSNTASATAVTVNSLPTASITPSGPTTFAQGGTVNLFATTGNGYTYQWMKDGVNIDNVTGNSFAVSTGGSYTVFVTANGCSQLSSPVIVIVFLPGLCNVNVPLNFNPTSVNAYNSSFGWTKANPAQDSAFIVRVVPTGKLNFRYRVTHNVTAYMGQLTQSTQYTAQVRTRCTSHPDNKLHKSAYTAPVYFTTTADPCPLATNLNTINITQTSALLSWTGGANANRFTVRYKGNHSGMIYRFRQTNSASVSLTTLRPGTTYTWDVKVFCDNISSHRYYLTQKTFTTPGTYTGGTKLTDTNSDINSMDLFVYPNPSTGIFTVAVTGLNEKARVAIMNIAGQLVYSREYEKSFTEDIDLTGMAKGLYLLKVESGSSSSYKKLVIN